MGDLIFLIYIKKLSLSKIIKKTTYKSFYEVIFFMSKVHIYERKTLRI